MKPEPAATRTDALVRLVLAIHDDRTVSLDGLLIASDGNGRWPPVGGPVALRLELPDSAWMADALASLLEDWAAEDAVVAVSVVRTAAHRVARVARGESTVSLGLRSPLSLR